jgi:hypothetical protein
VIAADGTHGWTAAPLPTPASVTVECPAEPIALFRQSPDDVSPESGDSAAATARTGTLLGAATAGYPASQFVLLAPARYQVVMPALRVRCGIEGYGPPEWFRLRFESPAFDRVTGLVRQPFVGPGVETLRANQPSPDEPTLTFLEDQLTPQRSGTAWTDVEAFYRDPADPARTLAVYASESARLFTFAQPRVRLHFPTYRPYPIRVLSSGGDWFVEIVSIFGDGAYSTLFHVRQDGTVVFHPLSRSSGEQGEDTRASWGLIDDELWIARATGSTVTLSGTPSPLYLATLRTIDEYAAPLEPSAEAFPTDDDRWIVGRPFRTEAEASRNAGGAPVRRYPR